MTEGAVEPSVSVRARTCIYVLSIRQQATATIYADGFYAIEFFDLTRHPK